MLKPAATVFVGKLAVTIGHGMVLVIIARSEGPEGVGLYTLGLALATPIFLFAHLRVQDLLGTHATPDEVFPEYVRLLSLTGLAGMAALAASGFAWPTADLGPICVALGAVKFAESLAYARHGTRAAHRQFVPMAGANIGRAVSTSVALGIGVFAHSLLVGLALMAVAAWLHVTIVDFKGLRPPLFGPVPSIGRALVRLAPLGLVAATLSLNQTIVRLVIEANLGLGDLARFAVVAYLVRAGSILSQALSNVNAPNLRDAVSAERLDMGRTVTMKAAARGALVGAATFLILVPVGPWIISLAFGSAMQPGYAEVAAVLLAGIPVFASTAMGSGMVALSSGRQYLLCVIAGLGGTSLSAPLLVPLLGLAGGALAWALGETVKLGCMLWLVRTRT